MRFKLMNSSTEVYIVIRNILCIQLCTILITLSINGCTSTKANIRPSWIDEPSSFLNDSSGFGFVAVGVASNIPDVGLRRNAADAMARTELAKIFKSKIKNMIKIYRAEKNDETAHFEQHILEVTKVFTNMELLGTNIAKRWYDSKNDVQYSLAVLSREDYIKELKRMSQLDKQLQQFLLNKTELDFKK